METWSAAFVLPANLTKISFNRFCNQMAFNRDSIIALILIMASGGLMLASFEIREPDYGVLSPAAWPRLIIVILGILSVFYFIQSLRMTKAKNLDTPSHSLVSFFLYWRNVFSVFIIFAVYLILLPYLGMLISNLVFSFVLLSVLGGWRSFLMHGLIAIGTSGGMWLLFTYALEVFLPRGSLTGL